MASMKWSDKPEVTIKKGNKATFDGVLVPEQNYRNYSDLVDLQPDLEKMLHGGDFSLCEAPTTPVLQSPLFWGVVGTVFGGFVIAKVLK